MDENRVVCIMEISINEPNNALKIHDFTSLQQFNKANKIFCHYTLWHFSERNHLKVSAVSPISHYKNSIITHLKDRNENSKRQPPIHQGDRRRWINYSRV